MLKLAIVALGIAAVGLVFALIFGSLRWTAGTRKLRVRLDAARRPICPRTVDFRELEGLPDPVQRFFRSVLVEGQPMLAGVHVQHEGTFNTGETTDRWVPFRSEQQVITARPGFDWNARIRLLPGVTVRAHDACVAGEGLLQVSVLGLVPIVDRRGTHDLAEGQRMRFLAEAVWYPTALLPSQGVGWQAVDPRSAQATLTDGSSATTLLFTFDERHRIEAVRAQARGRTVGGRIVPTPWHGRFWNYVERDGMQIPLEGEVAWQLPDGPKPYWRGRIIGLAYEWVG